MSLRLKFRHLMATTMNSNNCADSELLMSTTPSSRSLSLSVSSSATTDSDGFSPESSQRRRPFGPQLEDDSVFAPTIPGTGDPSYKLLQVIPGHVSSVSCLALCGEFVLSASQGKDIIVWQQPDLKQFAKFGQGDGSVKALVAVGNRVFTAHQDSLIRVWKISRRSENAFRLIDTMPTTKDYLGKFMIQSNYVQTRRHHRKLWIEHADSISCLTVSGELIYSGSWDKTVKVWRISDLKCLESIKAHDDAINALAKSEQGLVFSASADGKIKAWGKRKEEEIVKKKKMKKSYSKEDGLHRLEGVLEGHSDVSVNSVLAWDWDCQTETEKKDGLVVVYGGGSDGYLMGWKMEIKEDEENGGGVCWTKKLVCEIRAHDMAVLSMCVHGEILCSGSADKSIGIWRRNHANATIQRVGVIRGHQGPVKCLQAASPASCVAGGGFLLYTGSLDKSLRVWWVSHAHQQHCYSSSSLSSSSLRSTDQSEEEESSLSSSSSMYCTSFITPC